MSVSSPGLTVVLCEDKARAMSSSFMGGEMGLGQNFAGDGKGQVGDGSGVGGRGRWCWRWLCGFRRVNLAKYIYHTVKFSSLSTNPTRLRVSRDLLYNYLTIGHRHRS